jgi:hypothetical protein
MQAIQNASPAELEAIAKSEPGPGLDAFPCLQLVLKIKLLLYSILKDFLNAFGAALDIANYRFARPVTLSRFRQHRFWWGILPSLGSVGLGITLAGAIPVLGLPMVVFGAVWFFVDKYVIAVNELKTVRKSGQLIGDVRREAERLSVELASLTLAKSRMDRIEQLWTKPIDEFLNEFQIDKLPSSDTVVAASNAVDNALASIQTLNQNGGK